MELLTLVELSDIQLRTLCTQNQFIFKMPGKTINARCVIKMDSQHKHAPGEKEARQKSMMSVHTKTILWLDNII